MKINYSREILYHRHRLSHQQINKILGHHQNQLDFEEKISSLNLLAEFLSVADYFKSNDIWFLPLKGPLLSYRIYGDVTCRIYRDFDLLVKPEDAPKAISLLCKLGYYHEPYRWSNDQKKRLKILRRVNQLTLYHPDKYHAIEVHW